MMSAFQRKASRCGIVFTMAASLLISNLPLAFANPGDTNSVNTGSEMAGGTYNNTHGSQTVFNNPGGNIHLSAGTTVYGHEVDGNGNLTGNGGSILITAPGHVVTLDGNINVNALLNNGQWAGNGGSVQVQSAYLYQNGNIFANGINGGQITFNVGSLAVGPNAQITAMGSTGNGGQININATNTVNVAVGALIDASGKVIGTYDTSVINIQGSAVNLDGIIQSNGLVAGSKGGAVTLVALGGDVNISSTGAVKANGADGGDGGFVGIGASGNVHNSGTVAANGGGGFYTDHPESVNANAGNGGIVLISDAKTISSINKADITSIDNAMKASVGAANLVNNGTISANGGSGFQGWNPTSGGNGGYVHIKSADQIDNNGTISVDGGNGGSNTDVATGPVIFNPDNGMQQTSLGQDGGQGGNAGNITLGFQKDHITNSGTISAHGGNGGDGQQAISTDPAAQYHYAHGGNGGNGGNGGLVSFYGLPSQSVLDNTNVSASHGGQGGPATPRDCGCGGNAGACGTPGSIAIIPPGSPPPHTPPNQPPLFPPQYPKENPRVGDNLPPGLGSVLSYNRSIFMARAPLPIIQKRQPQPKPVPVVVTPPPPQPKPKPVPPKRRVPVRGYW